MIKDTPFTFSFDKTHEMRRYNVLQAIQNFNESSNDIEDNLHQLVKHVSLEAKLVCLWLIDKNTQELAMGPCYSSFPIKQSEVSRSVDVTSILETKEPILTNDIAGDLGVSNRGWIPRERVISYGGYPLMYGDRALGVLEIYSELELVEKLSDEISRKLGDIDPVYSRG